MTTEVLQAMGLLRASWFRIDMGGCFISSNQAGVTYISSAGLQVVLLTAKKLKASGGELLLAELGGLVKEVFEISGFYPIFRVFETEGCAVGGVINGASCEYQVPGRV